MRLLNRTLHSVFLAAIGVVMFAAGGWVFASEPLAFYTGYYLEDPAANPEDPTASFIYACLRKTTPSRHNSCSPSSAAPGDHPKEVFRRERQVFGCTEHASPVIVRVEKPDGLRSGEFNPLPHKQEARFCFKGFKPAQGFGMLRYVGPRPPPLAAPAIEPWVPTEAER